MAKARASFVCQNCGAVSQRWQGKCEACNEWNCISEEGAATGIGAQAVRNARKGRVFPLQGLTGENQSPPRILTKIGELDRLTGGGFVPGSVILLGGEPGIGKSTLLIQACATLASQGHRVVYISGEEAVAQVRMRAERLGLAQSPVELAAETSVEDIVATLMQGRAPALVVIDSIQTMWTETVESTPGTVTQVRASAQTLIRYAKTSGATVILVGHVTKDGQIAGPRVVEHMVDAVVSFEGEGGHHFRILRAVKNRFGPTDEAAAPGAAVFAGMEGTRPVLVEVQALVAPTSLGTPRRAVVGWDPARLSMVVAVLEAQAGLRLGQHDIYLNVAGGLRISEPAADLAAAAALVSSLTGAQLPAETVYFGEVALSGSIRPVVHAGLRQKEAAKLGFHAAVAPPPKQEGEKSPLTLRPCAHIATLVAEIAAAGAQARRGSAKARSQENQKFIEEADA
jgi:DNA repair protein RadA/Sms